MKKSISFSIVYFFIIGVLFSYSPGDCLDNCESGKNCMEVGNKVNVPKLMVHLTDIPEGWCYSSLRNLSYSTLGLFDICKRESMYENLSQPAEFIVEEVKKTVSGDLYTKILEFGMKGIKSRLEFIQNQLGNEDIKFQDLPDEKQKLEIGGYTCDLISGKFEITTNTQSSIYTYNKYYIYTPAKIFIVTISGFDKDVAAMIKSWEKASKITQIQPPVSGLFQDLETGWTIQIPQGYKVASTNIYSDQSLLRFEKDMHFLEVSMLDNLRANKGSEEAILKKFLACMEYAATQAGGKVKKEEIQYDTLGKYNCVLQPVSVYDNFGAFKYTTTNIICNLPDNKSLQITIKAGDEKNEEILFNALRESYFKTDSE